MNTMVSNISKNACAVPLMMPIMPPQRAYEYASPSTPFYISLSSSSPDQQYQVGIG